MNDQSSRWPLRLLSVAIAVVLWFFFSYDVKDQPRTQKTLAVTVTYHTPPGLIILDPVQTVAVTVRGTRDEIGDLTPFQVGVDVEFANARAGAAEVPLGSESVSLPEGLEIVSLNPNRLFLRLDREASRLLTVQVEFVGEPSAGALVLEEETRTVPETVMVSGPQSRLAELAYVTAGPISLEGHALDFEEEAPVLTPDPLIQIVEPTTVRVLITMQRPEPGPQPTGTRTELP